MTAGAVRPRQWHVYIVDLAPRVATKPGKQRPCLAVQPDEFAAGGLDSTVILPITSRVVPDAYPLRVRIPAGVCGLSVDSDVMIDQVLAWSHDRFRKDLGEVPDAIQDDVRRALREFLDV